MGKIVNKGSRSGGATRGPSPSGQVLSAIRSWLLTFGEAVLQHRGECVFGVADLVDVAGTE